MYLHHWTLLGVTARHCLLLVLAGPCWFSLDLAPASPYPISNFLWSHLFSPHLHSIMSPAYERTSPMIVPTTLSPSHLRPLVKRCQAPSHPARLRSACRTANHR
jgi:hypothetical protein